MQRRVSNVHGSVICCHRDIRRGRDISGLPLTIPTYVVVYSCITYLVETITSRPQVHIPTVKELDQFDSFLSVVSDIGK